MDKFTNGRACRLLSCPFADLKQCEAIYANWDMLIGIAKQGKAQQWRGLAGNERSGIRAVFYNIYGVRGLYLGGNTTKQGLEQRAAQ
ncbi:hypothetical protein WM43_09250 [Aeromonas veronii]|uniref:Uncharacterized protein n=1 Tax=Aeromonas veronii TaxID=654 RepID=A0AAC9B7A3_AERVE|nr:hypothetical protein WM43_09250 [Aeromonas veronii]